MKINCTIKLDTKLDNIVNELGSNTFGKFLAVEVHKHYTPFMPYNTGAYSTSINFAAWNYTHKVPYAQEVYTKHKHYRTDRNPFATAEYISVGESVAMPKIEQSVNNYIKERICK